MPTNLLACRPQSFGQCEKDAFKLMAELGIKNVEMPVPEEKDWPARHAEIKKYGLTVTSVSGGANLSEADAIQKVTHLAKGAKEFGAKIIFLSVKTGGRNVEECYKLIREMGDIVKAHGATLALETHPDMVTNADIGVKTVTAVNHPNVKLNYDCSNLYYYNEGVDHIAELKKFLPHTIAVHLKASQGKPKDWWFPALHESGDIINYPEIFRLCNAAGFYGPFTMEIEGIQGEKISDETAIARVANSVKYLKSIKVI